MATSALIRSSTSINPGIPHSIDVAFDWLEAAQSARKYLIRKAGNRKLSPEESRFMDRLTTALDMGDRRLHDCQAAIKNAARRPAGGWIPSRDPYPLGC